MLVRFILLFSLLSLAASAETATRATPVHAEPRDQSSVLLLVKPGDTLPRPNAVIRAPAGWSAVSLTGPHDVFVENRFIGKDLDVKPGSPLHKEPKASSPVLTQFTAGDDMEITGLRGRWTQIRINKAVTGYVESTDAPAPLPTSPQIATTQLRDTPVNIRSNQDSARRPSTTSRAGEAVSRTAAERSSLAALPRLFEGRLKSTRVPLRPRRPYDYALETEQGTRFAYVDLSKLLLTAQIENYLHRSVVVYGVARPVPDTKDIVITVESFQLR
jgi:hypothetical protein